MKMNVSMIAAISSAEGAIGKDGKLLVAISDDLKRFKQLTMGHPIVMGRKTFESIGRALPGRTNYVVTRNPEYKAPGIIVCTSVFEALGKAWDEEMAGPQQNKEIFVIGGAEIYRQAMEFATKIYFTVIDTDMRGDVFFPKYEGPAHVIEREDRHDDKTGLDYYWMTIALDR